MFYLLKDQFHFRIFRIFYYNIRTKDYQSFRYCHIDLLVNLILNRLIRLAKDFEFIY